MKFAAVVVLFALALVGVQSSVIPGIATIVQSPLVYSVAPAAPASVAIHAALHTVHAAPAIVPVVHAAPAVVHVAPAEGTYVAQTRGAVHVAPLPGHANSASSVNLQPAPGTL